MMARATGLTRITQGDLARHVTTLPQKDEIFYPLYDSATYLAAGQLQMNFFQAPLGQGTTTAPGATGAKTEADTNMTNAGMLPEGNTFYCTGIEFQFYPGISPGRGAEADAQLGMFWNDVYAAMKGGFVKFRIQNRDYVLDGPLGNFPPSNRLAGVASVTSTLTAGASTAGEVAYAAAAGHAYEIVPVYIKSSQNFLVQINWPALVALPSTTAARIFCRLNGRMIRNAQ
jgi:hypothetical protein